MKEYQLGLYEKAMLPSLNWKQRLETAARAGYDYVEISIDETDGRLQRLEGCAPAREVLSAMGETGVPVKSMCLSAHRKFPLGSRDPEIRARSMDIMEKALIFAERTGIRIIQLAGYDVYYEGGGADTKAYFAENLMKCAQRAAVYGVQLGFETMETPFMDTAQKAMEWVKTVSSPYLGVYPDIGNMTNAAKLYGHDAVADLESAKGHLLAMHLKETVPGAYREVPFSTGHVDFAAACSAARKLGVGMFVAECWHVEEESRRQDIAFANEYLRGFIDQNI